MRKRLYTPRSWARNCIGLTEGIPKIDFPQVVSPVINPRASTHVRTQLSPLDKPRFLGSVGGVLERVDSLTLSSARVPILLNPDTERAFGSVYQEVPCGVIVIAASS